MKRRLLPYQARWVQDRSGLKVIEKSRRIGLSWAEAYDSVMHAAEDAGDVYYQSYSLEMTRGFIDDCAEWAEHLEYAASEVGETLIDLDDGSSVQAFRIHFRSGKQIAAMPSSPRAFRSKGRPGDRAVVDEAAFVDDLAEVIKAATAFRVWGGEVHILSTHNGETNAFASLCRDIREGVTPGSLHTVSFRQALDEGLYRRICELTGDAWREDAEAAWEAQIRAEYGENAAEELDCIASAGSGTWLSWEIIRAAGHEDAGKPELYAGGPVFIGNDIGRRRDLWVAWADELASDAVWTREIRVLRNAPFSEHDAVLDEMVERYHPVRIGMDQTGMGEKPVEDAKGRYGVHRVEGIQLTTPVRLNVATILKESFEDRRRRIPMLEEVYRDLHSVRSEAGPTGAPRLVTPRSGIEGHADRFWAAALAAGVAADGAEPAYGEMFEDPDHRSTYQPTRWGRSPVSMFGRRAA